MGLELAKWVKGSAAFIFLSVSEVAIGSPHCVTFPRSSPNPSVEVCETQTHLRFRIGETVTEFEQDNFKSRLSLAIISWLSEHNIPATSIQSSVVEIWMTVPESNPLAAQPRAVVSTDRGNLLFWFDLNGGEWVLTDHETSILGEKRYPDSFGYRPQRILAKAAKGVQGSVAIDSLYRAGAKDVSYDGNGWYSASADVFEEQVIAARALEENSAVLQYAQVNNVYEWIADRQLAFEFKISSP